MQNEFFTLRINSDEIAKKLGVSREFISDTLYQQVNGLVASTRAFIIKKANDELSGWKRKYFLGENGENVKLEMPTRGIWMIELDPKVQWIEEGRDSVFMEWLLTNNAKAKTAKDGSRYAHIPFTQKRGAGGARENKDSLMNKLINEALRKSSISLKKVEYGSDGKPLSGTLHKLNIPAPGGPSQFPALFSKARSQSEASATGLKAHSGIFKLKGATVTQKPGDRKGSTQRDVTTFRTISSKHKMEGRWFYPKVEPFNSIKEAYEYAQEQWEHMQKELEQKFNEVIR